MWRYAGIRDVNRILIANVITAVVHVLATVLFYQRMPVTYYVMGAAIQLIAVAFIRFAYRLAVLEKRQATKANAINALVIGAGENGSQTIKLLSIGVQYRPVAVIDTSSKDAGKLIDGIPVYGIDEFENVVSKNTIKAVFLAAATLDTEKRSSIIEYCKKNQINTYIFLHKRNLLYYLLYIYNIISMSQFNSSLILVLSSSFRLS